MKLDYKKSLRKTGAFLLALLLYYVIHEGAHLIYALFAGSFKQINFLQMGVQIETYRERMSGVQTGLFCLAGPVITILLSYALFFCKGWILQRKSLLFRAAAYYVTLLFMLNDPVYLSVLYPYVGGGDMNGIALLLPENAARTIFVVIFLMNIVLIFRYLIPAYGSAYRETERSEKV
ncbi:hypothetical protein [Hungatella hathewayi]|uniref:hypothetical protein n=1 Tax=Hungatella hathewayi TaxID=154046 RepID=UPI0035681155